MTFNAQKYLEMQKQKKIKENAYYDVEYSKPSIGRVTESKKKSVKMTLRRKPDDRYDWPTKIDIDETTDLKYVFCGPIKLIGTTPFHI